MADKIMTIPFKESKDIKRFFKELGVYGQYEEYVRHKWVTYMGRGNPNLANSIAQTSLYHHIVNKPNFPEVLSRYNLSSLFRIFQIVTRIGYEDFDAEKTPMHQLLYYDITKQIGKALFSEGDLLPLFQQIGIDEKIIKENLHNHKVHIRHLIKKKLNSDMRIL